MSLLESWLRLVKSRLEIVFAVTLITIFSTVTAAKSLPSFSTAFFATTCMVLLSLAVYIYNDIIDRKMDAHSDKEKKKGRPIAHGRVKIRHAKIFIILTTLSGLFISIMLNLTTFIVSLVYLFILFLYSYPKVRFKKMFILKGIVTSLVLPAGVLIAAAAIEGKLSKYMIIISISYFTFLFFALPAGADSLDYEEDKAFNIKTIGNSLSWKANVFLFLLSIFSLVLSSGVLAYYFDFNYFPLIILSLVSIPISIYSLKLANKDHNAAHKLRPFAYIYLMVAIVAMSFGVVSI